MTDWTRDGARRKRKKSGLSIKKTVISLISILLISALSFIVFFTSLFEIREIRLHGGRYLPFDSLRTAADDYIGCNIFSFSADEFEKSMTHYAEVCDVRFRRRMFHTLDCYFHERIPVALVSGTEMIGVDPLGVIIPQRAGSASWDVDLPVITGINSGEIAKDSGKIKLSKALKVLELLKEFGFSPAEELSEIHLEKDDVILVWMGNGSRILMGKDNFHERIRNFKAVYDVLEESESFPKSIDLRFERQVVIR